MGDFGVCVKKKFVKKKKYLTIPIFVAYLCQFLSFMPFETYKSSQPYAVIQTLDNMFKHLSDLKENLTATREELSQRIEEIMDVSDKKQIRKMEKEILKNLRSLYEHCCHGLMSLVILKFRSFWCKLYNLNDANIGVYKLSATKKKKDKDFKTKKQTNGEDPMYFVVDIKNKQSIMSEMRELHLQIFVQNKVKQANNARVHKTRSKKEKSCPYIIPSVLIEIEQQFSKIANEFIDDFGVFTQTDSDIDDIEMEEN